MQDTLAFPSLFCNDVVRISTSDVCLHSPNYDLVEHMFWQRLENRRTYRRAMIASLIAVVEAALAGSRSGRRS